MNPQTEQNRTVAQEIAHQLNETSPQAIIQIERIINHLGIEAANDLVEKALEIEAEGGMLTTDGQRRRTPGGVYFHLVREVTPAELHKIIWAPPPPRPARSKPAAGSPQQAARPPARPARPVGFPW